jgi:4-hydroxy-4-methyl-2-oxoglutarate aldolase
MPSSVVSAEALEEIRQRYLRLYTGAIADMLDKRGYRQQVLPHNITPFTLANRVAGPAFTGQGYSCASSGNDDTQTRLACGGSMECAHWGEIMSTAARERGCSGAVVDGGVRDVDFINAMQYPVFARFKSSASSIGRWDIKEYQVTIKIGQTVIHPGDYVFGDIDGVVIVPADLTLEILTAAEDVYRREAGMRHPNQRRLVEVRRLLSAGTQDLPRQGRATSLPGSPWNWTTRKTNRRTCARRILDTSG